MDLSLDEVMDGVAITAILWLDLAIFVLASNQESG